MLKQLFWDTEKQQTCDCRIKINFSSCAQIDWASSADLRDVTNAIYGIQIIPGGSEGYGTTEVTLGGIENDKLNQKTMESRLMPGLYFFQRNG